MDRTTNVASRQPEHKDGGFQGAHTREPAVLAGDLGQTRPLFVQACLIF